MGQKIPSSWLSAYLDGEAPPKIRAVIDRARRVNPRVARELRELQGVGGALRSLEAETMNAAEREAVCATLADMESLPGSTRQLLSAYADGELSPERRRMVDATLLADGRYARLMSDLQSMRQALRSLPAESAPIGFGMGLAAQLSVEASTSPNRPPAAEVVSAYIDNEVRPSSAKSIAASLRLDRKAAKIERQYRGVGEALRSLPQEKAPAGLLASVADRLRSETGRTTVASSRPLVATSASAFADRVKWAVTFFAGMAASGLWFALGLSQPSNGSRSEVLPPSTATVPHLPTTPDSSPLLELVGKQTPGGFGLGPAELEDDRGPKEPEPKRVAELPLEKLKATLQPGQILKLDGAKVTFVCLDVQQMYGRLLVSLMQQKLQLPDAEKTPGPEERIIKIEVSATPDQMKELLATLYRTEKISRVLDDLDVRSAPSSPVNPSGTVLTPIGPGRANVRPGSAVSDAAEPPPRKEPAAPNAETAPTRKPDDPIRVEFRLVPPPQATPPKKN